MLICSKIKNHAHMCSTVESSCQYSVFKQKSPSDKKTFDESYLNIYPYKLYLMIIETSIDLEYKTGILFKT